VQGALGRFNLKNNQETTMTKTTTLPTTTPTTTPTTAQPSVSLGVIATLLKLTKRVVQRKALAGHWPFIEKPALGGTSHEYIIQSLPEEIRAIVGDNLGDADGLMA
jgi:hypothetical protein